jgi:hypothetical protein
LSGRQVLTQNDGTGCLQHSGFDRSLTPFARHIQVDRPPYADRTLIAHLSRTGCRPKGKKIVLPGPSSSGKTHLAVDLEIRASARYRPRLAPVGTLEPEPGTRASGPSLFRNPRRCITTIPGIIRPVTSNAKTKFLPSAFEAGEREHVHRRDGYGWSISHAGPMCAGSSQVRSAAFPQDVASGSRYRGSVVKSAPGRPTLLQPRGLLRPCDETVDASVVKEAVPV